MNLQEEPEFSNGTNSDCTSGPSELLCQDALHPGHRPGCRAFHAGDFNGSGGVLKVRVGGVGGARGLAIFAVGFEGC